MPFKSEKQRRYLWANEPEIARDWTDTYGSKIKKAEGGIMQAGVKNYKPSKMVTVPKDWKSSPDHPDTQLAYITKAEKDLLVKKDLHNSLKGKVNKGPGGVMSLNGWGDKDGPSDKSYGGGQMSSRDLGDKTTAADRREYKRNRRARAKDPYHGTEREGKGLVPTTSVIETPIGIKGHKEEDYKKTLRQKWNQIASDRRKKDLLRNMAYYAKGKPIAPPLMQMLQGGMTEEEFEEKFGVSISNLANLSPIEQKNIWGVDMSQSDKDRLSEMAGYYGKDYLSQSDFEKGFYGPKGPPQLGGGGDGPQPWWMQQGYPSYEAWKAAQGQGTTTVAEEVVETTSPFQQSLNTGIAQGISPYYVGANPTAANIAWGQQFGVDPRTMYMAEGGPIRQRYFFGKLVKKIGRAAKKVIKSPLGKIGLGIAGLKLAPMAMGQWQGNTGFFGKTLKNALMGKLNEDKIRQGGLLDLLFKSGEEGDRQWNPWKIGIGAATMLPFLMGGKEEDQDKPFDYDAAKNAYMNEIMNIKRGVMAGSLNPNQWSYLPSNYTFTGAQGGRIGYAGGGSEDPMLIEEYKKYVFEMEEMGLQPMSFDEFKTQAIAGMASGGRAGYYAGGQSIPSEYTMEDARKTAMQDRLGGITEVMKQADLYRQGDVGQMYMANGGLMASAVTGGEERDIATQMWDRLDKQTQSDYGSFENYFKSGDWIEGVKQIDQGWAGAEGGRIKAQEGGIMDLGGVEKDYRETGGFVPIGKEEKADDVPARLSLNEFVMTADAVRGMGDGDIDKGADRMEDLMETLEVKGKRRQGASDMFEVSERLSAVV